LDWDTNEEFTLRSGCLALRELAILSDKRSSDWLVE
jgi:hypothetical protein